MVRRAYTQITHSYENAYTNSTTLGGLGYLQPTNNPKQKLKYTVSFLAWFDESGKNAQLGRRAIIRTLAYKALNNKEYMQSVLVVRCFLCKVSLTIPAAQWPTFCSARAKGMGA